MFKNLKIGQKLIVVFILISLLASVSGVVSVVVMKSIDTQYSFAIEMYGFAQGDVGKAMASFCRLDGNVHDAVGYTNDANQNASHKNVQDYAAKFPGYLDTVDKTIQTEENRLAMQQVREAWTGYQAKYAELLEKSTNADAQTVALVQEQMVRELDPLYATIYNGLVSVMDEKVNTGSTINISNSDFASKAIVVSIALIIIALLLSILIGTFISRSISKPIKACSERLELLANGDLTTEVPVVNSKDETGVLANATSVIVVGLKVIIQDMDYLLGSMADGNFAISSKATDKYIGDFSPLLNSLRNINTRLSDTLSQINTSSDQVSSGSDQVASGAQALSQGATEQASSVEELAATINEISEQVRLNAANSIEASDIAQNVGSQMTESNRQMKEMINAMNDISVSSGEIGKIIKTIEDIAFQTNILALNAAVEAARAGAAGKGFAVVADEVRNLASKSAEASKNTSSLIESSLKAVENGTKIADETAQTLMVAVDGAKQVTATIDKISEASRAQADSIAQVTQGIDQISSVVQTNSATAEESAAASEELSGQAQMLKSLVSRFQLKDSSTSPRGLDVHPAEQLPTHTANRDRLTASSKY